MSDDPAQEIFRSLLAERGGVERFDETQKVVALKLAEMLASDAAVSAPAIVALVGLLPPKPSEAEAAPDLSKLTDAELATLDKLQRKATGQLPPTPEKVRRYPRRSYRQHIGEELALLADQIEGEQDAARRSKRAHALTDGDLDALRNGIAALLGLVALPAAVFAAEIEHATYTERAKWQAREREAEAARTASAPIAATAEVPLEKPSNVVTPQWGVFISKRPHGSGPPWADGNAAS
jgi:hypothetical protein